MKRFAVLIGAVLALMCLAFLGFAQAAAKDKTTITEGLIFWASIVAFPFLVIALVVLLVVAALRFANRFRQARLEGLAK